MNALLFSFVLHFDISDSSDPSVYDETTRML